MKSILPDSATCRNIAYFLLGIYAVQHILMFFVAIPAANKELFGSSAGTLQNVILVMAAFFYGSSLGSRNKDKGSIDPGDGPIQTSKTETVKTETQTTQEVKP